MKQVTSLDTQQSTEVAWNDLFINFEEYVHRVITVKQVDGFREQGHTEG